MDEEQLCLIFKHFEDVHLKEVKWGGRLRFICKYGQFDYSSRYGFLNLIGGADLYRRVVLCSHEMNGGTGVYACGDQQHVAAMMAHGEELGVPIIPVVDYSQEEVSLIGGLSLVLFIAGWIVMSIWAGIGLVILAALFVFPSIEKMLVYGALQRGQQYRDIFPNIHGDDRQAKYGAARKGGYII
jgi:hypothetical protein